MLNTFASDSLQPLTGNSNGEPMYIDAEYGRGTAGSARADRHYRVEVDIKDGGP